MNNGVKISKEDRDNLVKSYPLLRTKNRVIKNENKEGCSPLFLSALAGNGCDALTVDKINLLLDAGADPRRQSEITGFHFLTLLAQIQPEFYGKGSEAKYRRLLRRLVDMGLITGLSTEQVCAPQTFKRTQVSCLRCCLYRRRNYRRAESQRRLLACNVGFHGLPKVQKAACF